MNNGRTVFSQVMDFFPLRRFKSCVQRYRGDHRVRKFSCLDQFYCMAFAQLTGRESLRDIEACLRALGPKLYHAGLKARVSRNTLARANETRNWKIYRDIGLILIAQARALYAHQSLAMNLKRAVYALDSTVIDLLRRYRTEQTVFLSDQQFSTFTSDNCSAVQESLADRTVFQMDQATSPDQSVLWHHTQCGEDPGVDGHHCICAGSHREKGTGSTGQQVRNSPGFERNAFRENSPEKPVFGTFAQLLTG